MPTARQDIATPPNRQQEKSAAMQSRICKGAVRCLAARGYHRTSIKQVVEAASVSQGALQHHFPTKEDLMEATAGYLLGRSIKWFQGIKTVLEKDRDAFGEVIRRSWSEQFRTAEYGALLEILTAARTDTSLRKRVAPRLNAWRGAIERELSDLFTPIARDAEELAAILAIGRCLMTGLLVHDGLLDNKCYMDAIIDQWTRMVTANAPR